MTFDVLLEVLRTSINNEERKEAASQLRHLQENTPEIFLNYVWDGIASSSVSTDLRFFLACTVMDFVEQSWRNNVPKALQLDMINRYLQLLLSDSLPSLALTRKIAAVLSLMIMRCGVKAIAGRLPEPMEHAANLLTGTVVQAASNVTTSSIGFTTQCLITMHMFLKEAQQKRIGNVFPKLCSFFVPTMYSLFTYSVSWDHMECHLLLLYLLKCALRVFGFGVFEPTFYPYLLEMSWQLARAVTTYAQQQQENELRCIQRLLEYSVKIQLKMVITFPSRLSELSSTFFLSPEGAGNDNVSLFGLLTAIIENPPGVMSTDKMLCRSMLLFTTLMEREDCVTSTRACLLSLAQSSLLDILVERVTMLLADDINTTTLREWELEPERYVSELERDVDEEENITHCAEGLLLALTGSTVCATRSLEVTWKVVNAFLANNDLTKITAALHAIGTCYYTMSINQDPTSYIGFLTGNLFPLICGPNVLDTSPFVLRRVVWIIGMWCESVCDITIRRQVHTALASLLVSSSSIVVLLTTLHSIGHFMNDGNFTNEEISSDCVHNVLLTIQRILPLLRTPHSVKGLAGLVYSMIMRGILDYGSGQILFDVLLPAIYKFINETKFTIERRENNNNNDDDDVEIDASSMGMLLECIGACSLIVKSDMEERVWSLFPTVVIPCTISGGKLTPWVEDNAWELLLTMSRAVHMWTSTTHDALVWCLENMKRDTLSSHLVVRSLYTLLLLCPDPTEIISVALVDYAVGVLTQTPSAELSLAFFALLGVIVKRGNTLLRCHFVKDAVQRLLSAESVQGDSYTIPLAVLITWCLSSYVDSNSVVDSFIQVVLNYPHGTSFTESIVLLVDVSPSLFVTEELMGLLRLLLQTEGLKSLMNSEDIKMVELSLSSTATQQREQQEELNGDDDNFEILRDRVEMLLELFGDKNITKCLPHVVRLTTLFDIKI